MTTNDPANTPNVLLNVDFDQDLKQMQQGSVDSEGQPDETRQADQSEHDFIVSELAKLAAGEVTNINVFDQMLDDLADRAEAAGLMDELDAQLNAAADKLTELLVKEAARLGIT